MSSLFLLFILVVNFIFILGGLTCTIPTEHNIPMTLQNNQIHLTTRLDINAVGNYLMQYYNMRGIAKYVGICFVSEIHRLKDPDWLIHLPVMICPTPIDFNNSMTALAENIRNSAELLEGVCKTCLNPFFFKYPHQCRNFYLSEKVEMKSEIRHALITYGKEHNITIPIYKYDNMTVIYSRCKAGDSLMGHPAYGPTGFSYYKSAAEQSSQIVIVARSKEGICMDIRNELVKYLKKIKPSLVITFQSNSSFQDYSSIVFARKVYVDISSFAATAGFANEGVVHMPQNDWFKADRGFSHFIFSNATVLFPHIGKALNITCQINGCKHFSAKDTQIVLEWLMNN